MKSVYCCINVFDVTPSSNIAVSAISITPEQIMLSGAWVFSPNSIDQIRSVIADGLAIPLSDEVSDFLNKIQISFKSLKMEDFLHSAQSEVQIAIESFESHKQSDPTKRKKLVAPTFFDWPKEIDLRQAPKYLQVFGQALQIPGTDPEMEKVLTSARLVKFLIEKWRADEIVRQGRKYIEGEAAEVTLLPKSWLN